MTAPSFAWLLAGASLVLAGCGSDVYLGGAADAGASADAAGSVAGACEPCEIASDCRPGFACAQFAGDLFCASGCSAAQPSCAPGELCSSLVTASGASATLCVPSSDQCAPAAPPATDGGATCGALHGPSVPSRCTSCGKYSNDCQPNGCYDGWWCNSTTRRCQAPPKTCG